MKQTIPVHMHHFYAALVQVRYARMAAAAGRSEKAKHDLDTAIDCLAKAVANPSDAAELARYDAAFKKVRKIQNS